MNAIVMGLVIKKKIIINTIYRMKYRIQIDFLSMEKNTKSTINLKKKIKKIIYIPE